MRAAFINLVILIGFFVQTAAAQNKKPTTALETGFERKLGVVYKTVGKRQLEFDVYYPATGTAKPCPVIVYTHGGGWAAGNRSGAARGSFAVLFKELTKKGFCVVSVDYRLYRKGGPVRMRDCVIDCKDAIRYLVKNRKELSIDPEKLFVFGDSAGGHIAQMLLLTPPEILAGDADLAGVDYKVVGGVSWYGPCDFENQDLFNHDDRPDFRDRFGPRILGGGEVTPKEKLRLYREMSPVKFLKETSPPLLMIQGDKDTTIPVKHAYHMEKKAGELEAAVQTLIVKNSGHNWRTVNAPIEPSRDEIVRATVEFFVKHAGSAGASATHYPEFSWERLPLYMHVRKAKSYTDEEIAFLAKFPLITFEKANGHQDHGSVEAGTLAAAKAVKEINPKTKILYYRNVIVHYGGYAADKALGQIPGAMLQDKSGGTKLVRDRVAAYDLSNADLRKWWVEACCRMTKEPHIDGIFLDGNIKALERGYLARQIGAVKKQQTMDGYRLMMKQTRDAVGPEKLMIANILRARFENAGLEYLDYFDGSYLEGFFHNVGGASYEEYVAKGIDAMQKAARQGKIIAFTTGFNAPRNTSALGIDEGHATVESDAQARAALTYPLAIFLTCAEKHSYFRIHEGYSANEGARWMRWFPEYDRPLGPPNGPAAKDGFRYSRTFQHATVELDIQKRTASIQWQEPAAAGSKSSPAPNNARPKVEEQH